MRTAYCFDLDGTITSKEILPIIAAELGIYEELGALTDATIKGILPFESSFRLRCRLLNEVPLSRVRQIVSEVPLFARLFSFVEEHRADVFVITGNLDVWVSPLLSKLDVKAFTSTADTSGDKLIGIRDVLNKGEAVKTIRKNYSRIVAVGDGIGDVAMFEQADVGIAFGGTHSPVESLIDYADLVCTSESALLNVLKELESEVRN